MALIGSLAASATGVFNLDFLPERLIIRTAVNVGASNLSVVTSGTQLMSITSQPRINALAKFDQGGVLSANDATSPDYVASWIKLATGRINKATTITATNSVASTSDVYAVSTNMTSVARRAVEQSINPSANATFDNFEALFFDATNVLRAQITWANGFTDEYSVIELNALYASYHVAEEGQTLAGLTCIDSDSGAGQISQVVLFNGAGGTTVVLKSDYVQL
jgi:hypothetical protein